MVDSLLASKVPIKELPYAAWVVNESTSIHWPSREKLKRGEIDSSKWCCPTWFSAKRR